MKVEQLILDGFVAKLSEEERARFEECRDKMAALVDEYGMVGVLALSAVGIDCSE